MPSGFLSVSIFFYHFDQLVASKEKHDDNGNLTKKI